MFNSNSINLVGNLTKEPLLKYAANGNALATLSIAVNRRWKSQQTGESTEVVSFFSVVAFGPLAENVAASLTKGDRVVVSGRVDQRSWQDDEGVRHTTFEVVADEVATSLRFCTALLTKAIRTQSAMEGEALPVAEHSPGGMTVESAIPRVLEPAA